MTRTRQKCMVQTTEIGLLQQSVLKILTTRICYGYAVGLRGICPIAAVCTQSQCHLILGKLKAHGLDGMV